MSLAHNILKSTEINEKLFFCTKIFFLYLFKFIKYILKNKIKLTAFYYKLKYNLQNHQIKSHVNTVTIVSEF